MKKRFFLIILIGIVGFKSSFSACETNTTAPGCTTSKGLIATPNSGDNIYNFTEPLDFLNIKTRSKVFDINEESGGEIVENIRIRRDINVGMTFRKNPSTGVFEDCDYLKSLYMMLNITNEKD